MKKKTMKSQDLDNFVHIVTLNNASND